MTSAQVKNGSLLKKDFKAGQLPKGAKGAKGAKGDKGAPGDRGATGAAGPAGLAGAAGTARAYAQVTAAGLVDVSKGITVATHPIPGWYCLAFDPALGVSSASFIMANPLPIVNAVFPIELRWAATPTCAAGQLGVITYVDTAYTVGDRSFQILVP